MVLKMASARCMLCGTTGVLFRILLNGRKAIKPEGEVLSTTTRTKSGASTSPWRVLGGVDLELGLVTDHAI